MSNEKAGVSVNYEWGRLTEVVVGHGRGLVMPGFCDKVDFIYDKDYIEIMKETGGKPAEDVEPEKTEEVTKQIENFVSVLQDNGVRVYRPRVLNENESKYLNFIQLGQMQIYARDPMLVIGNTVIETSLKVPMRAKEKFPLRELIRERIKGTDARYVAMPSVNPDFGEDGIYIEGGDVLLNGKEIYVGLSGKGSNQAGIDWLQNLLGDAYHVHGIKISSEFEHLDCVMSLLRPGLGLLCTAAIVGELPESLRDWEWIDVSIPEAKRLGSNVLVLDKRTAIIDSQHDSIGEKIKKHDHNVIEVPYDKVATWGGAFRCSHHPFVREDG